MRSSISEQRKTLLEDTRMSSPARSIFEGDGRAGAAADAAAHAESQKIARTREHRCLHWCLYCWEAQLCGWRW